MSDDEFEQAIGTEQSEDAHEPGQPAPSIDDAFDPSDRWEGTDNAGIETIRRAKVPRTKESRQALAAAVAKFQQEKQARKADGVEDEGDFGPVGDDEALYATPKLSAPEARPSVLPPQESVRPAPAAAEPPAPSPDTELLKATARAEREALAKDRERFDKERESFSKVTDYEAYLESSPKAYRSWMETMRGTAMSDEEFRQEAADFVTMMSANVLGVKLPDETLSRIESQLARKAVSAYREKDSRRQLAEKNRVETERVEQEWTSAAQSLDGQFRAEETSKAYPWLAAEDRPGAIVVDVIRTALQRGNKLSWQEASKQANDFLKTQASGYFDKRKHLLGASPAPAGEATRPQETRPGRPQVPSQVTRTPAPEPSPSSIPVESRRKPGLGFDREAHRRETLRAFAPRFKPTEG